MAKSAILAIKIVADATDATKALDKTSGSASKFSQGLGKASAVAAVGLGALAAGALVAARAAAEDAQSQAILAQALKNSTGANDAAVAGMEDWITAAGAATGVADDELRPALATLARATGSVEESQKAAALAMDISAATGKDLGSVSAALAKGYGGNTTALGKLVPGLDKAALASKDMTKISAELARLTGGSAAAAADTAAGKFQRMQLAISETVEGIGGALLPMMTALSGVLLTVAQFAQENTTIFLVLAGVFAAIAVTIMAVNVAMKIYFATTKIVQAATKAWAAVQWILNAALTANPIGLVVLAVVALIAVLVLAYKKSDTFRAIVQAAFNAVVTAVRTAVSWIVDKLGGAFRIVATIARVYITTVLTIIGWIVNAVRTAVSWVADKLGAAFSALGKIAGIALNVLLTPARTLISVFRTLWDIIQKVINAISNIRLPSLPSWVPGFGGNAVAAAPAVPMAMAFGSSTTALSRSSSRGGSGGLTVNINAPMDPQGTARAVQRLLKDADVRTGRARFA